MYGCKCQIKDMYLKRKTWDTISIADVVSQVFSFFRHISGQTGQAVNHPSQSVLNFL